MKEYYISGLNEREKYVAFIKYVLPISDAFSVVYFRYKEEEKYSETVSKVKRNLETFKIYEKLTNEWPSTITLNEFGHLYLYTLYRCTDETESILLSVDNMWEWDYDKYPMDLCFFKNGYSFFYSSAHENDAFICTDSEKAVSDLRKLGLKLEFLREREQSDLFYDEKSLSSIETKGK